jgi:hypothetical protein
MICRVVGQSVQRNGGEHAHIYRGECAAPEKSCGQKRKTMRTRTTECRFRPSARFFKAGIVGGEGRLCRLRDCEEQTMRAAF